MHPNMIGSRPKVNEDDDFGSSCGFFVPCLPATRPEPVEGFGAGPSGTISGNRSGVWGL